MSTSGRTNASPVRTMDSLDARAVLILLGCCACWGVNQPAIKIANAGISPILQAGLRSLLAGALVFAWSAARGIRLFERDSTLAPGLTAGLLFAFEFLVLYVGLAATTASRGVVFLYLAPFVVAFGAHFFVPGDRLTWLKLIGLSAALLGLMIAMGESLAAPGRPTLAGDLLCVLSAILWGATTILIRSTALKAAPAEKTLLYQLAVSGVVLVPASWLVGESGVTDPSPRVLLAFAYTFVLVAFISYIAWFWLVRRYPPTLISAFTFLAPVFGVVAGNLMLDEPFTPSLAAALVLVAFGIYVVNRPQAS
jgi:drug/metabolite transporter (DMT)-like permease